MPASQVSSEGLACESMTGVMIRRASKMGLKPESRTLGALVHLHVSRNEKERNLSHLGLILGVLLLNEAA